MVTSTTCPFAVKRTSSPGVATLWHGGFKRLWGRNSLRRSRRDRRQHCRHVVSLVDEVVIGADHVRKVTQWCVGTTFDTLLLPAAVDTLRALPHVALLLAPANN